jgi:hypothetical protein
MTAMSSPGRWVRLLLIDLGLAALVAIGGAVEPAKVPTLVHGKPFVVTTDPLRPAWDDTIWNGEAACTSVSEGMRAIVSLERARLVYYGPADHDENLLLAPPTRANPNLLGGHRLWLGPQSTWAAIWPPPAAWEYRPPVSAWEQSGSLFLDMPETKDGWPQLKRIYRWLGSELLCEADKTPGERTAQIIQILQIPPDARIEVTAADEPDLPAGYVRLPADGKPFAKTFPTQPHVRRTGRTLEFIRQPSILKAGFRPQTITATRAGWALHVRPKSVHGHHAGQPDEGFFTQLYLGGPEPFIELEQLSPLFTAEDGATFTIALSAERITGPGGTAP